MYVYIFIYIYAYVRIYIYMYHRSNFGIFTIHIICVYSIWDQHMWAAYLADFVFDFDSYEKHSVSIRWLLAKLNAWHVGAALQHS